jgi:CheY-like chemotaxis protein
MPVVLCIDDNAKCLCVRKVLLETKGYSVLTADSGQGGLQLLAQKNVEAIVLDYKMPGMDGLKVAKAIRQTCGNVPILLLTGYAKELPKELMDTVDAFVMKGQPAEVLLTRLQRILGGERKRSTRVTSRFAVKAS